MNNLAILRQTLLIVFIMMFISCDTNKTFKEVKVLGRQILVDNSHFLIKGICYHPVPKGSGTRGFMNLDQDLKLMVEAGVNTIRVYTPINDKVVLDKINAAGIKLIIGFGYNQEGKYDILSGTYINYINKYKNHGAILMWELGNEYNYHPEWFDDDIQNWYKILNNAAELIHNNDPSHPVTTAHGEIPNVNALSSCPNIDVWGMNVYRWDNPKQVFNQWKKVSEKPMYLSEAGADSYMTISKNGYDKGVNEEAQAAANENILNIIFNAAEVCSGVTMFSFVDGWWKDGNNNIQDIGGWAPNSSGVPYDGTPNEEYWGMVDLNRSKKQAYNVLKKKYTQSAK